jgi:predicted nucleic-acid-binding protein
VRAVDTNILARYYLGDDPTQSRIAAKVLGAGEIFVPKTVLLELAWVLRSIGEQPATQVLACLAHLISLPAIHVESRDEVEQALRISRAGIDFADALHLASSHLCNELLTFDDRSFARRAQKLNLAPPVRRPSL